MNNKPSLSYLILSIAPFFFGCGGPLSKENKNASASSMSLHVGNEKYFIIDTQESVVAWTGSSVHGKQKGYAYISKGELMIENGQLMGGSVEIEMNKIEGPGHLRDNNLTNHLKGSDFFDVKKFPFSTIAITRVESINGENKKVTGNLTIKGVTHPVTFPVKIEIKDRIVKASGKLVIDRTQWDVRYKSGKFFDNLKDQAIADSIELNIMIVAKNKHLNIQKTLTRSDHVILFRYKSF